MFPTMMRLVILILVCTACTPKLYPIQGGCSLPVYDPTKALKLFEEIRNDSASQAWLYMRNPRGKDGYFTSRKEFISDATVQSIPIYSLDSLILTNPDSASNFTCFLLPLYQYTYSFIVSKDAQNISTLLLWSYTGPNYDLDKRKILNYTDYKRTNFNRAAKERKVFLLAFNGGLIEMSFNDNRLFYYEPSKDKWIEFEKFLNYRGLNFLF